jgi:hypothetical protein
MTFDGGADPKTHVGGGPQSMFTRNLAQRSGIWHLPAHDAQTV